MRRLVLLLVVAIGLSPGTWWRSPAPIADRQQTLHVLPLGQQPRRVGEMRLLGAWELRSPNSDFHGYSALAALDDGTLLAVSDRGRRLRFSPPGASGSAELGPFSATDQGDEKRLADVEALTRDPRTGRLWAAYENSNVVELREPGGAIERARPAAMQDWPSNAGPEAMVRLADGRFIVLSEGRATWTGAVTHGLLFPGDPVDGAEPVRFRFAPPPGSRPVDLAQLPDGRVLVLTRSIEWGLPPGFSSKLVLADPAQIAEGKTWSGRVVAEIAEPLPTENYEGLAIAPGADGAAVVWLISDDNQSIFQRTLLLKLAWRPNEKARGASRAPR